MEIETDELEVLRTRIDRIEREAAESFNEHMDTDLDIPEYETTDRIWIEHVGQTVRDGLRPPHRPQHRCGQHLRKVVEYGRPIEGSPSWTECGWGRDARAPQTLSLYDRKKLKEIQRII
ncbi:hypothetical protein [Halopiger aswanensis]|uniref:hypothetical protein n=1 Tax=Halopiger aswanensis TaxID=148449 RepID=UPI001B86022E|nr:hypothetical protein [Halopiger aswanensis]